MRYRDYKEFFEGGVYHIYNRGHNKMMVFRDDEDYGFFLQRLYEILGKQPSKSRWLRPLPKESFTILCYCLMPNHFHFLIRQETNLSISKLIGKLSTSYSIYFNKKYQNIGTVFQDRFKSKEVDNDEYLGPLSVYVHRNPHKIFSWPYSSLANYISNNDDQMVNTNLILSMYGNSRKKYSSYVKSYRKLNELLISDLTFDE